MKIAFKAVSAVAALVTVAALSACGGGGSSSTPLVTTTSSTGIVADGYLNNAKVCLDKNGNKKCDAGEPFAMTGAGGAYTLTDVTAADLAAYPVIVEVTTATVDEERGAVTTPYVLSAPAGKTFVSPLTTLVHNQMETSGISAIEAEQTVKTQLGLITMSPLDNYKPGVSTASSEAKLLANVAKVVATTIADNKKAIDAAVLASGGTTTVQAVVNMISQQVMQNLAVIVQQVKSSATAAGTITEANVTAISGTVAVSTADPAALKQQLAANSGVVAVSDIAATFAAGMYWVESQTDNSLPWIEYEKIQLTAATGAMNFHDYTLVNNVWQLRTSGGSGNLFMTASGWQADPETVGGTFDAATGVFSSGKGFKKMIVRGVKTDVSGQPISAYLLNSFATPAVVGVKTFPAGSEAIKTTMVPQVDIYKLKADQYAGNTTTLNSFLATYSSTNGSYTSVNNFKLRFGALGADNSGALELTLVSNANVKYSYSSTYKKVTVNNIEMLIADTSSVSKYADEKLTFFTVYNGVVRYGYFQPKNVAMIDYAYNFNKTATSAILAAAGMPVLMP